MARRARGPATGVQVTEALGGGPFVVTGPTPVEPARMMTSYRALSGRPSGVVFRWRVGPEARLVEVETCRRDEPTIPIADTALITRLLSAANLGRVRYPLVIERRTFRVKVGGRMRAFKGCALGDRVAGTAEIDGLTVTVTCADGDPGSGLTLARLEGKPLNELLARERKRWREMWRELEQRGSA